MSSMPVLQQAFGKRVIVSGEYIWKYTHNAFDFSVLGNTPITFPIDWHNSKIPGYALHVEVPEYHHFSAYSVMSSVAARFFPPQVAGAGATVGQTGCRSALTTTRSSTRLHTCNTHTPRQGFSMVSGAASTGDTIRARWPDPHPATASQIPIPRARNSSTTLNGQPAIAMVDKTFRQPSIP